MPDNKKTTTTSNTAQNSEAFDVPESKKTLTKKRQKYGGRKKGTPNRKNADFTNMLLDAVEKGGGSDLLLELILKFPELAVPHLLAPLVLDITKLEAAKEERDTGRSISLNILPPAPAQPDNNNNNDEPE